MVKLGRKLTCLSIQAFIATAEQCRDFPEIQTNTCLRKSVSVASPVLRLSLIYYKYLIYVATLLIFGTSQARSSFWRSSSSHYCLGLEKVKERTMVCSSANLNYFPSSTYNSGSIFQNVILDFMTYIIVLILESTKCSGKCICW